MNHTWGHAAARTLVRRWSARRLSPTPFHRYGWSPAYWRAFCWRGRRHGGTMVESVVVDLRISSTGQMANWRASARCGAGADISTITTRTWL